MAKASINTSDGTKVVVEGDPEEIKRILSLYLSSEKASKHEPAKDPISSRSKLSRPNGGRVEVQDLVNSLKGYEDFDALERSILDKGTMLYRVLLPLFVSNRSFPEKGGLTSGDIVRFLTQFNIKIDQGNAARTLSSEGSKYVIGDTVRVKGRPVRYKISRSGIQHVELLIKSKWEGPSAHGTLVRR